jgi:uncharacterized membrane protein (UPF0127 family)
MRALAFHAGLLALVTAGICACACGCGRKVVGRPVAGDIIELRIGAETLQAEVANDDLSRANGLMFRKSLPQQRGMIFVYNQPDRLSFWMRNTYLPLSIAFLDDQGVILQIEDMRPKDESHTVSKKRVRYALEVNQGWFQRKGIKVGDQFVDFEETVGRYRRG